MIRRSLLATASIPGGDELRLFQHGDDFIIALDRNELMNSRMSGSEQALAVMTCDRLASGASSHLLIGGYGMGFTLRAALATLGTAGRVTLVELVPEIIDWARGPMAALAAGGLDDRRVTLCVDDVAAVITGARSRFDAILLDVDNGPEGLTRTGNDAIYTMAGLAAAKDALRPGGILAIWSVAADVAFTRRLKSAGFTVEQVMVRARSNGKGAQHIIWFAAKAGPLLPISVRPSDGSSRPG